MRILITGSDGLIGSALKNYLTEEGHPVWGTVYFKKPENRRTRPTKNEA